MKKNLTTFYIVRHGETDWNVKEQIQGHSDIPLNDNGMLQAHKLANDVKHITFDLVFSSDLLRAKRTIEIIALDRQLKIEVTKLLRERDFGKYEGKQNNTLSLSTYNSLLKRMSSEQRKKHRETEGVESDDELISRVITFLRETAITHPRKTILVGTHGGILRILLIHLGLATYKSLPHGSISNTSYIKLSSDGVDFFVDETKGINISNE